MTKRNTAAIARLALLLAVLTGFLACRWYVTQPSAWIMYVSNDLTNMHLYKMRPNGSDRKQLTYAGTQNSNASWSPDGSKIAFISNRDGFPNVFLMNADGSCQVNLTQHTQNDDFLTWSPDGGLIVFSLSGDIWAQAADGSGTPIQLTSGANTDTAPKFIW
jgi:Tol biopolymer transport system component